MALCNCTFIFVLLNATFCWPPHREAWAKLEMPVSWAGDLALIPKVTAQQMLSNNALQQAAKVTSSPAPLMTR
jgi:hypothetical protein